MTKPVCAFQSATWYHVKITIISEPRCLLMEACGVSLPERFSYDML